MQAPYQTFPCVPWLSGLLPGLRANICTFVGDRTLGDRTDLADDGRADPISFGNSKHDVDVVQSPERFVYSSNALLRHNIKQNKRLKPGRLRWGREASLMPSDRALSGPLQVSRAGADGQGRGSLAQQVGQIEHACEHRQLAVRRPRPLLFRLIPI
jgi:hypothetical protein